MTISMAYLKLNGDPNWYKIIKFTDTKIYYFTKTDILNVDYTVAPGKDTIEDISRNQSIDAKYNRSAL